jgi:hypothetical protein
LLNLDCLARIAPLTVHVERTFAWTYALGESAGIGWSTQKCAFTPRRSVKNGLAVAIAKSRLPRLKSHQSDSHTRISHTLFIAGRIGSRVRLHSASRRFCGSQNGAFGPAAKIGICITSCGTATATLASSTRRQAICFSSTKPKIWLLSCKFQC